MKKNYFAIILIPISFIAATIIYFYVLPDFIKDGGYLIIGLLGLSIMLTGYIIERFIIFYKLLLRTGSDYVADFFEFLKNGDITALKIFLNSNPNMTSEVVLSGLIRLENEKLKDASDAKKMSEFIKTVNDKLVIIQVQLEQNLTAISTIASISTMVGLLGTTFGMIKSFQALSQTGAPDAVQLSLGISEALINTAGGLIIAIMAIVSYNYFTSTIDKNIQQVSDIAKRISVHLFDHTN